MRILVCRWLNEMQNRKTARDRGGRTQNFNVRLRNSTGFTLIEAIITIVIVGIISGIAAMIILEAMSAYSKETNLSGAHYQTRLAMERMSREIRTIRQPGEIGTAAIGIITGNPTNSLIFTDLAGATIRFWLNGQTLNRTVGGVDSPLAVGVTTLQFRHYDSTNALTTNAASVWTIEITMTDTQGTDSLQMLTRVHPRNF
jgi:prepilin-type N-terminal cleavage/methylation domain-containing protein